MRDPAARRVVGIDPSLTGTGIAAVMPGQAPTVRTVVSKPVPNATVAQRDERIEYVCDEVTAFGGADLVVIEGPALGKASPHTWDRAGLWWRIVHRLLTWEVPLAICPPTVRAKWATGKGNAGKAAVVAAIARMWPDVPLDDDNAADALVLASMGAQHAGIDTPARLLARHADALGAVDWPRTHHRCLTPRENTWPAITADTPAAPNPFCCGSTPNTAHGNTGAMTSSAPQPQPTNNPSRAQPR